MLSHRVILAADARTAACAPPTSCARRSTAPRCRSERRLDGRRQAGLAPGVRCTSSPGGLARRRCSRSRSACCCAAAGVAVGALHTRPVPLRRRTGTPRAGRGRPGRVGLEVRPEAGPLPARARSSTGWATPTCCEADRRPRRPRACAARYLLPERSARPLPAAGGGARAIATRSGLPRRGSRRPRRHAAGLPAGVPAGQPVHRRRRAPAATGAGRCCTAPPATTCTRSATSSTARACAACTGARPPSAAS